MREPQPEYLDSDLREIQLLMTSESARGNTGDLQYIKVRHLAGEGVALFKKYTEMIRLSRSINGELSEIEAARERMETLLHEIRSAQRVAHTQYLRDLKEGNVSSDTLERLLSIDHFMQFLLNMLNVPYQKLFVDS